MTVNSLLERIPLGKLCFFALIIFLAFSSHAPVFAQEPYSPRSLTIQVYGDGVASVEYVLDVDVTYASIDVSLFGGNYENLLAVNHLGDLLDFVLIEGGIKIYTLGTYMARINYDTADLTSEEGEIYTFSLVSPVKTEIILPKDADIISFNPSPIRIKSIEDKTVLTMPAGNQEIVYTIMALETYAFDAGTWNGVTYQVKVVSNSTVSDFTFSEAGKLIGFNVGGPDGTVGFCNVTFSIALLGGPYTVLVDGSPPLTLNEQANEASTSLYFTYSQSVKHVEINGATVIPEFPSAVIPLLFMSLLLIAAISKTMIQKKDRSHNH